MGNDEKIVKSSGKSRGIENLKPFPKGKSGNPRGKRKGQRDYATIYREALKNIAKANDKTPEEIEEMLEVTGLKKALKGDFAFWKDVRDRIHGKPVQPTDLTTRGEKILFVIPQDVANKYTNTDDGAK